MGVACIRVTGELMREILCLPQGTVFVGNYQFPGDVVLTVSHPDLKDGKANPQISRGEDGRPVFVGWGQ